MDPRLQRARELMRGLQADGQMPPEAIVRRRLQGLMEWLRPSAMLSRDELESARGAGHQLPYEVYQTLREDQPMNPRQLREFQEALAGTLSAETAQRVSAFADLSSEAFGPFLASDRRWHAVVVRLLELLVGRQLAPESELPGLLLFNHGLGTESMGDTYWERAMRDCDLILGEEFQLYETLEALGYHVEGAGDNAFVCLQTSSELYRLASERHVDFQDLASLLHALSLAGGLLPRGWSHSEAGGEALTAARDALHEVTHDDEAEAMFQRLPGPVLATAVDRVREGVVQAVASEVDEYLAEAAWDCLVACVRRNQASAG